MRANARRLAAMLPLQAEQRPQYCCDGKTQDDTGKFDSGGQIGKFRYHCLVNIVPPSVHRNSKWVLTGYRPSISPTGLSDSMQSQTTFSTASSGAPSSKPAMPHSQPKNNSTMNSTASFTCANLPCNHVPNIIPMEQEMRTVVSAIASASGREPNCSKPAMPLAGSITIVPR